MSGRHRRADQEIDVGRGDRRVGESLDRRGHCDVRQRLVVTRETPLTDPRSFADPLVGRVDDLRELVVRHHTVGHVRTEARDPDSSAGGRAEHAR